MKPQTNSQTNSQTKSLLNNTEAINDLIRELLRQRKISQLKFAELVNLTPQSISDRLTRTDWRWNLDTLRKWLELLDYEMEIVVWKKDSN